MNLIYCFAMIIYFLILRMQDLDKKYNGETYESYRLSTQSFN